MQRQLRLIEANEADWRLDPATKTRGLQGVQRARAALRASRPAEVRLAPLSHFAADGSLFGDVSLDGSTSFDSTSFDSAA